MYTITQMIKNAAGNIEIPGELPEPSAKKIRMTDKGGSPLKATTTEKITAGAKKGLEKAKVGRRYAERDIGRAADRVGRAAEYAGDTASTIGTKFKGPALTQAKGLREGAAHAASTAAQKLHSAGYGGLSQKAIGVQNKLMGSPMKTLPAFEDLTGAGKMVGRHPILSALAAVAGLGAGAYGLSQALGDDGDEKVASFNPEKRAMFNLLNNAYKLRKQN